MRLRRLELVIIGVTLAFGFFIGGYFTGRNSGTVSVSPTVFQTGQPSAAGAPSAVQAPPETAGAPVPPPEEAQPITPELPPAAVGQPFSPGLRPTLPPALSRDSEGRININLASRSELMDLPGIGGSLSERIIDYRNANGPFRNIEELRNVSGIGEKRFEAIMNRVTVGG